MRRLILVPLLAIVLGVGIGLGVARAKVQAQIIPTSLQVADMAAAQGQVEFPLKTPGSPEATLQGVLVLTDGPGKVSVDSGYATKDGKWFRLEQSDRVILPGDASTDVPIGDKSGKLVELSRDDGATVRALYLYEGQRTLIITSLNMPKEELIAVTQSLETIR